MALFCAGTCAESTNFITSPAGAVAKYCDECVCVCLCVREDISGTTRAIFTKFFITLYCSGAVPLRPCDDILTWMGNFGGFYSPLTMHCMGRKRYEFRYEGPISLKFTYLPQSRVEFNFLLLKGIISTNYFEITRKLR